MYSRSHKVFTGYECGHTVSKFINHCNKINFTMTKQFNYHAEGWEPGVRFLTGTSPQPKVHPVAYL